MVNYSSTITVPTTTIVTTTAVTTTSMHVGEMHQMTTMTTASSTCSIASDELSQKNNGKRKHSDLGESTNKKPNVGEQTDKTDKSLMKRMFDEIIGMKGVLTTIQEDNTV